MKVNTTLSIDHKIKEDGQKQAKKKNMSFSEYVESLITKDK